jgi:hypothetical protein
MEPGTAPSRTDAQQRADEIRIFTDELSRLKREGVLALTEAQREAVAQFALTGSGLES